MLGFCKHEWELKDKTVLPSPWEQWVIHLASGSTIESCEYALETFRKTVVLALACKKCGKLVIRKESNP